MDNQRATTQRQRPANRGRQLSLRGLMLFVAVFAAYFGLVAAMRENDRKTAALRQREQYTRSVIECAPRHVAVCEDALLSSLGLRLASGQYGGPGTPPGNVALDGDFVVQSFDARADWPIEEIEHKLLSAMAHAVSDAGVVTSPTMTVAPKQATVKGDEGWVEWTVGKVEQEKTSSENVRHRLKLKVRVRAWFLFDEPLRELPPLYHFGKEPIQALLSSDAQDRRAGAVYIRPASDRAQTDAVLSVIDRETDDTVASRLFESLENVYRGAGYDAAPVVLEELRAMLEQDHRYAHLAARTILRSDRLWEMAGGETGSWSDTARQHLRRASMAILRKGDPNNSRRAVEQLCTQLTPQDREAVDVILEVFQQDGERRWSLYDVFRALEDHDLARYGLKKMFTVVTDSDRPEVWYGAAEIIESHATLVLDDGRKAYLRAYELGGVARRRMQLVSASSENFQRELKVLGDDAFEFLMPLVSLETHDGAPGLYARACHMLGALGDRRAIPLLIRVFDEHQRRGDFDRRSSPYYQVCLIQAVNQLTGQDIAAVGIGPSFGSDEVHNIDWAAVQNALQDEMGTYRSSSPIKVDTEGAAPQGDKTEGP